MSEKNRLTPPSAEQGLHDEGVADEPFFKRWSRLKADSATRPVEPPVSAAAPEEGTGDVAEASSPGAEEQEKLPPGDEDMPPIESLNEDSDFSGFMSPRVSAVLRQQALRKLFRSPKFNVISQLDDYIDDYRNFPALGDTITADMKHAAMRLLKKQMQAAETPQTPEAAEAEGIAQADTAEPADEVTGQKEQDVPEGESLQADASESGHHEDDGVIDRDDSNEHRRDA